MFAEVFQKLCDTHRIVEYYLVDNQGSFLLVNAQGRISWLAMASEELMNTYAGLAQDDRASDSIVAGLKSKQMMPFFYSEKDFNARPAEWHKYLHPANQLQGQATYYYTYISNSDIYEVDANKIVSYQQFLVSIHKD